MKIALLLLIASPLTAQGTLTPFQQQKARALLAAKLPCLGCHELDGDGGRSAPSLTTVGARRSADYIRRMVENPQSALRGAAMPRTTMPEAERDLIVRFLSSDALAPGKRGAVAGERSANAPPAPPALSKAAGAPAAPDGEALYGRWCANCHGALGHGDGPNAKYLPVRPANHASAERMRERPDDALYDVIAAGGATMGKSARMPGFGATLTAAEIRVLVAQLRALCRCEGPRWSRSGERP